MNDSWVLCYLCVLYKVSYIDQGYQGKFKNVMEYDAGYDIVLVSQ